MEQISKISDILIGSMFEKGAYSNSIKKATAFSFWGDICGSRFSKFSKCYDIKGSTLYVAVKNPQVMQELIFNREQLLSKINDYFSPLNVTINDIRYDYKIWNKTVTASLIEGDETLSYYSKDEVEEVNLSNDERREIETVTNTISKLSFLDEKLKNKYAKNIVNSIKVKKLREQNGV